MNGAPNAKKTAGAPLFTKQDLRRLIIPLVIEQALAMTIGMFDIIMVASVGESAVSGVSLVDTVNILIVYLFTALATGGAIVAGQYLGAGDRVNANNAARQLLLSTTLLSLAVMALCLLVRKPLLAFFFGDVETQVMGDALLYFSVVAVSYPFIAIYNAVAALFRGMGNSQVPMVNGLIMNGLNIALNATFIFGFSMGVFGAALGTVISRLIGAFIMLCMLRNPTLVVSVRAYSLRGLERSMMKRILGIGLPNGLENGIFQLGRIIMTSLVATFGTASIAAHAVGTSLTGLEVIPGQAMGLAMITVIAQCAGAKDEAQAQYYTKYMMKLAYLSLLVLNISMLFLLRPVLGFYKLTEETFTMAYVIMLIHGVGAMTVWPFSFTLPNAFRASGDVKFPMGVSVFSMFVFRIGCSFLLARVFHLGVFSVWIAMVTDWTFRAACFFGRWRGGKWKGKAFVKPQPEKVTLPG